MHENNILMVLLIATAFKKAAVIKFFNRAKPKNLPQNRTIKFGLVVYTIFNR
jgi:hypothetical protein